MAITIGNFPNGKPIFGAIPELPVEVPAEVTRWKIRNRSGCLAIIYMRRGNQYEQWVLTEKDGKLIPGYRQATNRNSPNGRDERPRSRGSLQPVVGLPSPSEKTPEK